MLTLVIYDISDDRQRTKLAKHLKDYGLRRVQKSGFLGDLNPNDRMVLSRELKRFLSSAVKRDGEEGEEFHDSIYVIPLCSRCISTCRIISDLEISIPPEGQIQIVG